MNLDIEAIARNKIPAVGAVQEFVQRHAPVAPEGVSRSWSDDYEAAVNEAYEQGRLVGVEEQRGRIQTGASTGFSRSGDPRLHTGGSDAAQ